MSVDTRLAARAVTPPAPSPGSGKGNATEADETFADRMSIGFEDLIDVVNPLQQLPVVSSIYREATGESISIPARLAGGFLFGGLPGLVGSAVMVAFEEITGDSVLGHLGSVLDGVATGPANAGAAGPADGSPAGILPWLKADGAGDGAGSLPSLPSLTEALKRKTAAAEAPESPKSAGVALESAAAASERPAPEALARLYALQATARATAADAPRPLA